MGGGNGGGGCDGNDPSFAMPFGRAAHGSVDGSAGASVVHASVVQSGSCTVSCAASCVVSCAAWPWGAGQRGWQRRVGSSENAWFSHQTQCLSPHGNRQDSNLNQLRTQSRNLELRPVRRPLHVPIGQTQLSCHAFKDELFRVP
jgi:hypothetical protein